MNLKHLRRPSPDAPEVVEPVTVLIPARDEAAHVEATVRSVLAQTGVPDLSVVVLDDDSDDATAAIVRRLAEQDPRLRLAVGTEPPPPGWLGKPWACHRLAIDARARRSSSSTPTSSSFPTPCGQWSTPSGPVPSPWSRPTLDRSPTPGSNDSCSRS